VDRVRGTPQRLFDEFTTSFPLLGRKLDAPALPPAPFEGDTVGERHVLALTAREVEMDSQRHINNCVYLDWLTEGLSSALGHGAAQGGGTWRPRDLRIEYLRPAQAGDRLHVATTTAPQGRRGLRAWQEVARADDGALCGRATSRHLAARG
jgi:acyl-CoA thioesterase FadM